MKKIVLLMIVSLSCLFSNDFKDDLFKDIKAGSNFSKHFPNKEDYTELNCEEIGSPLGNLPTCYEIKDTVSIGAEKDFVMFVTTISGKIIGIDLMKQKENKLSELTFSLLSTSNFKFFNITEDTEEMSFSGKILKLEDFYQKRLIKFNQLNKEDREYTLNSVLVDVRNYDDNNIDIMNMMKTIDKRLVRTLDILETYDNESNTYFVKMTFTNPFYQAILVQDFMKKNKGGI